MYQRSAIKTLAFIDVKLLASIPCTTLKLFTGVEKIDMITTLESQMSHFPKCEEKAKKAFKGSVNLTHTRAWLEITRDKYLIHKI